MENIILKNISDQGIPLQACFCPFKGMNLMSYQYGNIEVIDQSTITLFEQRCAGLGALIGPHFHRRKTLPHNIDFTVFPHAQLLLDKGIKDPLSHGIARYVPWEYTASSTQIVAKLDSKNTYKGIPLNAFEGYDFSMTFNIRLIPTGLHINYQITGGKPSVLGLHYYYSLPNDQAIISGSIHDKYRDQEQWKSLPLQWTSKNQLMLPVNQPLDFGFIPKKHSPNDHEYIIHLKTTHYNLNIEYNTSSSSEFACQIFHPDKASYVCIEPLTARTPQHPVLKDSSLEAKIQITSPLK